MASPGAPTLVLVPTELEARALAECGGLPAGLALLELCGFGPISAAARTAALLERLEPRRVLLLGVAGAYDPRRRALGSALGFARVAVEGLGVGAGEGLRSAGAVGFPSVPESARAPGGDGEEIALVRLSGTSDAEGSLLLTTCAASGDAEQAGERRRRHPAAEAEDMEGFGVALACALRGVPLAIVRGLSNVAGDRDRARWRLVEAVRAAREVAIRGLEAQGYWERSP